MTNYFEQVKTTDEIKARYKELVKKYHPDIYGDKGNEILKEIHNQLEKVLRNADTGYFQQMADVKDTDDIRNLKKELVKEALRYTFPEGALLALYWENHIRPCNHKNPLSQHEFSGWNIWSLEISMVLNDFYSSDWSTFSQYREAQNFVDKGEKSTKLTLAVYGKKKKKNENSEETEELKFYKGYSVFNYEQTKAGKIIDNTTKLATNYKPQLSVAS